MKKVLLLIGVFLIVAGVICFCKSAASRNLFLTVMDGDSALFEKLRNSYTFYFRCGIALVVPGLILLLIRFKILK